MIEPARNAALESAAAATTISTVPAASAIEPALAPIQGAFAVSNCATPADAASATMPLPAAITLLVLKRCAGNCGPSEKKSAPIDHEDRTASAARMNGRRTTAGMLGALQGQPKTGPVETGSGIQ